MSAFRDELTPDEAWEMLMHLPSDSPLMAELANDPEYAPLEGAGEPSFAGWTSETSVLADVYDMLGVLVKVVAGLAGKPPQIDPYPRPGDARRAAIKAAEREQSRAWFADLCERLGVNH